jgi:sialate O-acetylesterase
MTTSRISPGKSFPLVASVLALLFAAPGTQAGEARFANLFSDHMVLQSGEPLRLWGSADEGARIELTLDGRVAATVAGRDGAWSVEMPAMQAGGPHQLALQVNNQPAVVLEDIWIGEVWLCSGQSNMAYPVSSLNESGRVAAHPPGGIRLLTVPRDHSTQRLDAFRKVEGWQVASPETVAAFSAACYLMAVELQQELGVPFGLINASWGGSAIEAWVGAEGLQALGGFERRLELVRLYGEDNDRAVQEFALDWQQWWQDIMPGQGPWVDGFDDSNWKSTPDSLGNWQNWPGAGLQSYTGMLWYRASFELADAQAAMPATLQLGGADELDITWVNGTPVGTAFGWGDVRRYELPAGTLRGGGNQITVNVYNSWGAGGLNGPPESMRLELGDGSRVPLGKGWRYQAADAALGAPPMAPWESITGLTGLYNAMIAPLQDLGLSGVLWYQGESNAGRANQYERLLSAMISHWRGQLGNQALPFVVIQLPNFGQLPQGPEESGWAELRYAQQRVAVNDPRVGVVITVDSADRTDLHPPNKRIVGRRAAAIARGLTGTGDAAVNGVVALNAVRQDGSVVIELDTAGEILRVVGSADPAGFELCNASGHCRYVSARLDSGRVVLDASAVENAAEVRHAWADAPLVNLFGGDLPVSSFRLPVGD